MDEVVGLSVKRAERIVAAAPETPQCNLDWKHRKLRDVTKHPLRAKPIRRGRQDWGCDTALEGAVSQGMSVHETVLKPQPTTKDAMRHDGYRAVEPVWLQLSQCLARRRPVL